MFTMSLLRSDCHVILCVCLCVCKNVFTVMSSSLFSGQIECHLTYPLFLYVCVCVCDTCMCVCVCIYICMYVCMCVCMPPFFAIYVSFSSHASRLICTAGRGRSRGGFLLNRKAALNHLLCCPHSPSALRRSERYSLYFLC
jgi:hypothetical protein